MCPWRRVSENAALGDRRDLEREIVPQTGRHGFDEFLKLERRDSDFVGVNRPLKAVHSGKWVVFRRVSVTAGIWDCQPHFRRSHAAKATSTCRTDARYRILRSHAPAPSKTGKNTADGELSDRATQQMAA